MIVYLSRTRNTQAVARMIQRQVGGDLVARELVTPYPAPYQTTVNQVAQENTMDYLPPLKTKIDRIDAYDVIFVGFPTRGMQLPPPIKTFLKRYRLSGKVSVPFNTKAGYRTGSSIDDLRKLAPDSQVLDAFTAKGGIEWDGVLFVMESTRAQQVHCDVKTWLQWLKLLR